MKSETKICQNCKKDFTIEPDDFSFYEKIKVPAPTWCPECRMIRRFNFRNEKILFRRKDFHNGEIIFSGFSPDANVVTYENAYWFGSEWDPLENGMDYDFTKLFFEQLKILLAKAPIPARSIYNMVNSDYCNEASECKDSYLCFNTDFTLNGVYLRKCRDIKDSMDSYELAESELCYENVLVDKSYRTLYSTDCESCVDVWFSKGLRGCINCFGCVNLRNKSNYFFNEPCSKDEYEKNLLNFKSGSFNDLNDMKKKAMDFWLLFPNKFYHGIRVVNSTGERLFNSKNVKDSYYVKNGENLRYGQDIWGKTSNCYDYSVWGDGAENIYECMTCGMGCYNLKFCFNCWEGPRDLEYCIYCIGSKNCFGCVGLYKKEYCIFNKQYTKKEYNILVSKIIEHMNNMPYVDQKERIYRYGEFFPFDMSPNSYNESMAQDFFPLDSESVKENGFIWREIKSREFDITIDSKDLPDNINNVTEKICKEIIKCESCGKAYKIIPMELQFYKRMVLPIPHLCHDCRFIERFKLVNPPKLWHRKCMHEGCSNEFETSYSPDRPEIIYCEKCYQNEVY